MAAEMVEAMTGKAEDVDVHFGLPDDVRPAVSTTRSTTAEAAARGLCCCRGVPPPVRGCWSTAA